MIIIMVEVVAAPSLSVIDRDGARVSNDDWWLRHTSGQGFAENQ